MFKLKNNLLAYRSLFIKFLFDLDFDVALQCSQKINLCFAGARSKIFRCLFRYKIIARAICIGYMDILMANGMRRNRDSDGTLKTRCAKVKNFSVIEKPALARLPDVFSTLRAKYLVLSSDLGPHLSPLLVIFVRGVILSTFI